MINRYFNPTIYNEQGYMDFIAVTENKFSLVEGRAFQYWVYLTKNAISFFTFHWLDTS